MSPSVEKRRAAKAATSSGASRTTMKSGRSAAEPRARPRADAAPARRAARSVHAPWQRHGHDRPRAATASPAQAGRRPASRRAAMRRARRGKRELLRQEHLAEARARAAPRAAPRPPVRPCRHRRSAPASSPSQAAPARKAARRLHHTSRRHRTSIGLRALRREPPRDRRQAACSNRASRRSSTARSPRRRRASARAPFDFHPTQ